MAISRYTGLLPNWPLASQHVAVSGETPYVILTTLPSHVNEEGRHTEEEAIRRARYIATTSDKATAVMITGPRGWVAGWGPDDHVTDHKTGRIRR